MTEMFDLDRLEFPRIREELAQLCFSEAAKERARSLTPSSDIEKVREDLQASWDALMIYERYGELPLAGLQSVSMSVHRAMRDASLNCAELMRIAAFLRCIERLHDFTRRLSLEDEIDQEASQTHSFFEAEEESLYRLKRNGLYFQTWTQLEAFPDLAARLDSAILSEEELSDRASSTLFEIRSRMREKQQWIRQHLEKLMRSQQDALQDSVLTMRNGRYVLPVKASHRHAIPGLIHDASASGQTIFVEPTAVLDRNNEIRELQVKEQAEIARILKAFSEEVASHAELFLRNEKAAITLDALQAQGKLAKAQRATRPEVNERGIIRLKQARHPLIDRKTVVPIDLEIGKNYQSLMVTGPNTGGKTVSLKTCGLLTLMAMSGLLIPVADGSEISVFEQVLADIGDEQSIEQSLSTFSSHMRRLVQILDVANERSLVLIDELGSGTDPSEGAALAISICEELRHLGAIHMVSTHYRELKVYALETEGVENASCSFDVNSLKPTYKLMIGVPGVSHAFVISQRLGLPLRLIERAKQELNEANVSLERVLQKAEDQRLIAEKDRAQSEAIRQSLEKKEEQLSLEKQRLQDRRKETLERIRYEARKEFEDKLVVVDQWLDELKELIATGQIQEASRLGQALRGTLRTELREIEGAIAKETLDARKASKKPTKELELKVGEYYYVPLLAQDCRLLSEPDQKGMVQVSQGSLSMRVEAKSLEPAHGTKAQAKQTNLFSSKGMRHGKSGGYSSADASELKREFARKDKRAKREKQASRSAYHMPGKMASVSAELMLIGLRAIEAEPLVERFLDDAVLAGLSPVRIVHGKGTGALKQLVRSILQRHPHVKHYEDASFGQGDAGVTVVELD